MKANAWPPRADAQAEIRRGGGNSNSAEASTSLSARGFLALESRPVFLRVATILLAAFPAALALWWVANYGVDVPTKDDWDIAPLVVDAWKGHVSFRELFAQQQEARTILPKLIFILGSLTGRWDMRMFMFLSVVWCALTLTGIYFLLRRSGFSRVATGGLLAGISAIIFSAAQSELWVWASGFPSFMPAMFLVAALCALEKDWPASWKFGICLLCTLASSFTLSHGLLLWGLTFPALLLSGSVARWKHWAVDWTAACLVCAAVYFNYYERPAYHPPFAPALPLIDYLSYFCMFLGGLFATVPLDPMLRPAFALKVGAALLIVYLALSIYTLARFGDVDFRRRVTPWFALSGYSIGAGLLAALGRIGFGLPFAISSRYVTFSLYFVVALAVVSCIILSELRTRFSHRRWPLFLQSGALVAAFVLLLFLGLATKRGLRVMEVTNADTRLLRSAVVFGQVADTSRAVARAANNDAERVDHLAQALAELKLLRPEPTSAAEIAPLIALSTDTTGGGTLEAIYTVGENFSEASGFAFLQRPNRAADGVLLAYEDASRGWVAFALSDDIIDRRDLQKPLRSREAPLIGWRARFPKSAVPPGAKISAWAIDSAQPRLYPLQQRESGS